MQRTGYLLCCWLLGPVVAVCQTQTADARQPLEQFEFVADAETPTRLLGRVLVQAADGGLLVEDRAGTLWTITPAQFRGRTATGHDYTPLSAAERTAAVKAEFGDDFRVRTTKHYLIVANTSDAYAQWCGELLERFYAGYFAFWEEAGLSLQRPTELLTVIILKTEQQFRAFYAQDVGQKTESSFGYYSIRRNRTVLYDFAGTADEEQTVAAIRRATAKVPFNVATVVHEATHHLGFNSGLHTRYADNPVWLTEGIAMFFETPDFRGTAWKTIGRSNEWRARSFKAWGGRMSAGTVGSLVQSDERFRSAETAGDAYTEAWALTHYLMKRRTDEFVNYVRIVSQKPALVWDKPEQRMQQFVSQVGSPEDFERLMQSYLKKYRR